MRRRTGSIEAAGSHTHALAVATAVTFATALACAALLAAAWPVTARAAEPATEPDFDTSFEGVYTVTGSTSTGATRTIPVSVTALSAEEILFETRVGGFDFSASGPAQREGADRIVVSLDKRVPFLGSGSGTVVLERVDGVWTLDATGAGRVLGTDGTATGDGRRTSDLPPPGAPAPPAEDRDVPMAVWVVLAVSAALLVALVALARRRRRGVAEG